MEDEHSTHPTASVLSFKYWIKRLASPRVRPGWVEAISRRRIARGRPCATYVGLRAALECLFDRAIKGVELEAIEARVAGIEACRRGRSATVVTTRNINRRL